MKYLLVILLILVTYRIKAQDLKLAGVEYFTYPKVKIREGNENVHTRFQEFGTYANYPTALKNGNTVLVNGFLYGQVQATLYNNATGNESSYDFHKIAYNFMVIHKWNKKWSLVGRLSPTLAGDFEASLSGRDFLMQGTVSVSKKISEQKIIGGGLLYTTRLGKPMLLPSFQFRYKTNKHLMNIYLPAIINYSYTTDNKQKLYIGFRLVMNGANFNVSNDQFSGGNNVDRLNYFRVNIGPTVSYQLTRLLQIEATGGLSTFRKYQFEDIRGTNYKYNSTTGAFFNIGIAIVPPQQKNKQSEGQP